MKKLLLAGCAALSATLLSMPATAQIATGYQAQVGNRTTMIPDTAINPHPVTCISGCSGGSVVVATTDKSGTIAAGATAQTAIALNASRKGWCIQNPSTAGAQGIGTAESLWVRVNGAAGPNVGTEVVSGNQVCNSPGLIDTAAVSVYATTISHKYNGFEVQ